MESIPFVKTDMRTELQERTGKRFVVFGKPRTKVAVKRKTKTVILDEKTRVLFEMSPGTAVRVKRGGITCNIIRHGDQHRYGNVIEPGKYDLEVISA